MSRLAPKAPLTGAEKVTAFKAVTTSLQKLKDSGEMISATDKELTEIITRMWSVEGGRSGPVGLWIWYKAAGLKLYAAHGFVSPYNDKPIFKGASTLSAAREIYGISDPGDEQISLF